MTFSSKYISLLFLLILMVSGCKRMPKNLQLKPLTGQTAEYAATKNGISLYAKKLSNAEYKEFMGTPSRNLKGLQLSLYNHNNFPVLLNWSGINYPLLKIEEIYDYHRSSLISSTLVGFCGGQLLSIPASSLIVASIFTGSQLLFASMSIAGLIVVLSLPIGLPVYGHHYNQALWENLTQNVLPETVMIHKNDFINGLLFTNKNITKPLSIILEDKQGNEVACFNNICL